MDATKILLPQKIKWNDSKENGNEMLVKQTVCVEKKGYGERVEQPKQP